MGRPKKVVSSPSQSENSHIYVSAPTSGKIELPPKPVDETQKLLRDPRMQERLKVRATKLGYWGHKRRFPGDVFTLLPVVGRKLVIERNEKGEKIRETMVPHLFTVQESFSHRWMEQVDEDTPTSIQPRRRELDARKVREDSYAPSQFPKPTSSGIPALDDNPADLLPDGPLVEEQVI